MEYVGGNSGSKESFMEWCDTVFTANTFYDFNTIHDAGISDEDRYMICVAEIMRLTI